MHYRNPGCGKLGVELFMYANKMFKSNIIPLQKNKIKKENYQVT